jgi:fatty acid desaturase
MVLDVPDAGATHGDPGGPPPRSVESAAGTAWRAADIFLDLRIRSIPWRDLTLLRPHEVAAELLLPALLLSLSLLAAAVGWVPVALGLSFMFFLSGLRLVHNAFHHALGLPPWADELVLWAMSFVLLGSMHAIRHNHLRHHALMLGEGDVEGRSALMPWWRALLYGPVFTALLHTTALGQGTRALKLTVWGEMAMSTAWVAFVFAASGSFVLRYHVLAMGTAHCLTAFFAVWTVHHHCDRTHYLARTLRNRFKNAVTLDMFRHIEHHLFPAVPTCHLAELSIRLDRAAPELKQRMVF